MTTLVGSSSSPGAGHGHLGCRVWVPSPEAWPGNREGALSRGPTGLGTSGRLPGAVVLQSFLATDPISLAIAGFLGCDLDNVFSLLNNHSGKRDSNFE